MRYLDTETIQRLRKGYRETIGGGRAGEQVSGKCRPFFFLRFSLRFQRIERFIEKHDR